MPAFEESEHPGKEPQEGKGLTLSNDDFARNTVALFDLLDREPERRERFIMDPVGELASVVMGRELPEQHKSDSNRVLFALLADDDFMGWLAAYPAERDGQAVTQSQFYTDFANAVVRHGSATVVASLFKQAADGYGLFAHDEVAQQLVTGPEKSVATPAATPSTSDQSAHSSSNANGIAFGDPRVVDPAIMRALIEDVLGRAKVLAASGVLADLETDPRQL